MEDKTEDMEKIERKKRQPFGSLSKKNLKRIGVPINTLEMDKETK